MTAAFQLNDLVTKLKDSKFPSFWEDKIQMIIDPTYKVKRYDID